MKVKIEEVIQTTNIERKKQAEATIAEFAVQHLAIEKSIMDAVGDLVVGNGDDAYKRLGRGTAGQVLATNDAGTDVYWKTLETGGGSATMTNKSGSNCSLGEIAIIEEAFDSAFTTSNIPNDHRVIGVCGEAINNNASGKVLTGPQLATVLVQGNVSRGHWLVASSTTGRAASAGYQRTQWLKGVIGIATTEYTGGGAGSVSAILFPWPILGKAGEGLVYFAGGDLAVGGLTTQVQKLIGGSDTRSTTTMVLGAAKEVMTGGTDPTSHGYIGGGTINDTTATNGCDKLVYSTETLSATNALTTNYRGNNQWSSQEGTQSYAWGGRDSGASVSRVTEYNQSTDATADRGTSSYPGKGAWGDSDGEGGTETKGYHMSDYNTATDLEYVTYSTDTFSNFSPGANIRYAPMMSSGRGGTKTYGLGGGTPSAGTPNTNTGAMAFSTETYAEVSGGNLPAARSAGAGQGSSINIYGTGGTSTNAEYRHWGSSGAQVHGMRFVISGETAAYVSGFDMAVAGVRMGHVYADA